MRGRPRLSFSGNVLRVLNLVTRRHEVERIIYEMPSRFFVASFPLPEGDAEVRVEPKRARAYAIIDEARGTVFVVSERRIRVIIDSGTEHVMVPGRLMDRERVELMLLLGA